MQSDRSLAREVYDWRRMPAPTERFRQGHRNAAAFDLEAAIDHLKSSVEGLLGGWAEGRGWDYASLLQGRVEEVERAEQLLAQGGLAPPEAEPYAAYLDATRSLLDHLARALPAA